jgi:hypothetical protein
MAAMRFLWRSLLLATAVLMAHADPLPSILLVAKPGLLDPNFRETVVLVTRAADAQTIGVILNRPTDVSCPSLRAHRVRPATGSRFFSAVRSWAARWWPFSILQRRLRRPHSR